MKRLLLAICLLICLITAKAADSKPSPVLVVSGAVKSELRLTLQELRALPRTKLKAMDHDGVTREYEGVIMAEILKKAGVPLGEDLRGPAMATYVAASAPDGYQVVFALPELDPAFKKQTVLIADRTDGKDIIFYRGPLRLVVPGDRKPARWIRQVDRLVITRLPRVPSRDSP